MVVCASVSFFVVLWCFCMRCCSLIVVVCLTAGSYFWDLGTGTVFFRSCVEKGNLCVVARLVVEAILA